MCWSWKCLSFGSKLQLSSFQLSNISFKWKSQIPKDLFLIAETWTRGNSKNKMKGELPAFCGHWEWSQGAGVGWGAALWSHTHCCSRGPTLGAQEIHCQGLLHRRTWRRSCQRSEHIVTSLSLCPLSLGTASPSLGAEGREHSPLCTSSFPGRELGLVHWKHLSVSSEPRCDQTHSLETRGTTSLVLGEGEQSRQQIFPRTFIWQGRCRTGTVPAPPGTLLTAKLFLSQGWNCAGMIQAGFAWVSCILFYWLCTLTQFFVLWFQQSCILFLFPKHRSHKLKLNI